MKKIFLLILFIFTANVLIQSQPQFKIILKGGYNAPVANLKGDGSDTLDIAESYVMKSGYSGGLDIKYFLGQKRNLGVTAGVSYNTFSSGEFDNERFLNYTVAKDTGVEIRKVNIIQVGLGAEYDFSPRESTNPFAGIELNSYFYSGNTEFTSEDGGVFKSEMKSATRFGLALSAGVDVRFNKLLGASFGFKYHIANIIGKKSDANAMVDSNGTNYELNDKEFTVQDVVHGNKNISYIQLTAGVTLSLNEPKRTIRR